MSTTADELRSSSNASVFVYHHKTVAKKVLLQYDSVPCQILALAYLCVQLFQKIVIQRRACDTDLDKKGRIPPCPKTWRDWIPAVGAQFQSAIERKFANHEVKLDKEILHLMANHFPDLQVLVLNSDDAKITDCMSCQIKIYAETEIIIGLHGAGENANI